MQILSTRRPKAKTTQIQSVRYFVQVFIKKVIKKDGTVAPQNIECHLPFEALLDTGASISTLFFDTNLYKEDPIDIEKCNDPKLVGRFSKLSAANGLYQIQGELKKIKVRFTEDGDFYGIIVNFKDITKENLKLKQDAERQEQEPKIIRSTLILGSADFLQWFDLFLYSDDTKESTIEENDMLCFNQKKI